MRKISCLFSIALALALLLMGESVFAGGDTYTFDSIFPCPEGFDCGGAPTDLPSFISRIYLAALAIAGALAVGMIVVGGLQYTYSSAAPSQKADARDRIIQAVSGLALLLGAVFILTTINPRLSKVGQIEYLIDITERMDEKTKSLGVKCAGIKDLNVLAETAECAPFLQKLKKSEEYTKQQQEEKTGKEAYGISG